MIARPVSNESPAQCVAPAAKVRPVVRCATRINPPPGSNGAGAVDAQVLEALAATLAVFTVPTAEIDRAVARRDELVSALDDQQRALARLSGNVMSRLCDRPELK